MVDGNVVVDRSMLNVVSVVSVVLMSSDDDDGDW